MAERGRVEPSRLAWLGWALFGATALAATLQVIVLAHGHDLTARRPFENGWPIITFACVAGAFFGAVIVARYPRHPVGWLLLVGQVGTQLGLLAQAYALHTLMGYGWGSIPDGRRAEWFSSYVSAPWALSIVASLFLVAPDGTLLSRRWRVALGACIGGLAVTFLGIAVSDPNDYDMDGGHELGTLTNVLISVGVLAIAAGLIASAVALVRRLRAADGEARLQLRWIAASAALLAGAVVVLLASGPFVDVDGPGELALQTMLYLAYASLPVCTAAAVLRHRLYDIELIVSRAVLLTLATAFSVAGYVALVVVVGGNAGGFWPSLLTTALVAMAFQPLRLWVVRLADRLAYGARAAPYEALSDLSRRLGEAPDPAALLPAVARAAGEAVSATAAVAVLTAGGVHRSGHWPDARAAELAERSAGTTVPVGPEPLGSITVLLPRGRELREPERVLLAHLAEQAALAFRNAGLSAELAGRVIEADRQAADLAGSRRRLIAARDEERARLELAIRRDVVAHLSPLPRQLADLADLAASAPIPPEAVAARVDACTAGLEALREITRGVYPAQLARSGLGPALSSHLTRWGRGTLEVGAAAGQRFDGRVEAATYFCFAEGVRDFAPPVDVTLDLVDGDLVLTLSGTASSDGGLQRMRDRVEALGGGVSRDDRDGTRRIAVRVPTAATTTASPTLATAGRP